ncbi:SAM-dependent methyltransferase [Roseofilum casamattae]|uniref:SAM-dependent methyltransferase n=1 Tax=Roseofilum casamattae BLCC-M143 TaxID=3022442 RepID=A0ABT7BZS2_9CYAN|nr:SAM-dependent methyltransferase [Roseofilum casamattae]MDJ1184709.1 SAM-dependent methyltransferase [Roseofilum casamattae BLCC-M143]
MNQKSTNPSDLRLEFNRRLSQSLLWQLERNYFDRQGIRAWNTGAVPHYVTSNPTIAQAYAEVILAHLRDRFHDNSLDPNHPLYILELGAGCGRFAFHCLRYLESHLPDRGTTRPPVVYVMSDFTQSNLNYWQQHDRLHPFLDKGLLDFALVDATEIGTLQLAQSGQAITAETLTNPLVVIANYFFDSLPQDVFAIKNGQFHESLVTLTTQHPNPDLAQPDLIDRLIISFGDRKTSADYYDNPDFNVILADYQTHLNDTVFLFSPIALNCLHQLHEFAGGNLLLLSADKGYSRLQDWFNRPYPRLTRHGQGFSMMVNYHAIGQYTQHLGGTWLTSPYQHTGININGFLFGKPSRSFPQTEQAYCDRIMTGGPDDFFSLKKAIEPHYKTLSLSQLLAYLRLSHWDVDIFSRCFPALMEKLEDAPETIYSEIFATVEQIWNNYFPIQEKRDLAFLLGAVLYTIGYFSDALEYFQRSQQLYGEYPATLYNIAMCHYGLHQFDLALDYLEKTLTLDPDFAVAREARIEWQAEQK